MKTTNEMTTTSNTRETVTISRAEYERLLQLQKANEELRRLIAWYEEELRLAKQKEFGSSSEAATEDVAEQMQQLFDESEAIEYMEDESNGKKFLVKEHERTLARKSGSVHDILPENIQEKVVEYHLTDTHCPNCGEEMTIIGYEERVRLTVIPTQYIKLIERFYTYACKNCEKETDYAVIVKTPKTPNVLPGSYATPEVIAHIMVQKFVMGAPLYRQELDLNRQSIQLSRQTMSNWLLKATEKWLEPLYDELHKRLLRQEIIHADETTLQVLHEPDKSAQSKSYMWLYRTGKHADNHIILYEYCSSRAQTNPIAFLKDFTGYLQTDGYSGYNGVPDVTRVGCFAHLRRKFEDAVKAAGKGSKPVTALQGVAYCSKIFDIEKNLADLSCEERYIQRQKLEKPILDEFYKWAERHNCSGKSKLSEAFTYMKNQWSIITNYLLDGRLEVSNNLAERSIKPFVIDRKNFLFANTPKGAKASAIMFSIIETAKANHLDPYSYLVHILTLAPTLGDLKENSAAVVQLLPENAPNECRIPE